MNRARALTLAMLLCAPAAGAAAQSPWADSPQQSAAPAASPWPDSPKTAPASPWPSSPAAPQQAAPASPWPNAAAPRAAAPAGPSPWTAAPQRDCNSEFLPLRQDAEKRAGAIKAAAAKKSQPELCAAFKSFAAAEAKMVKYVADNSAACGIPPKIGQDMKANHSKTLQTRDRICSANAGPAAAPPAPSLSDALGTSRVPGGTGTNVQKGGGTFNTLTGNPIAR